MSFVVAASKLSRLKDIGTPPLSLSLVLLHSSTTWQGDASDPLNKGIGVVSICEAAAVGLQRWRHSRRENDTNREFSACGYGISIGVRWPKDLFARQHL